MKTNSSTATIVPTADTVAAIVPTANRPTITVPPIILVIVASIVYTSIVHVLLAYAKPFPNISRIGRSAYIQP